MRPITRRAFLASSAAVAFAACTPGGSGSGSKQVVVAPQLAAEGNEPPVPTPASTLIPAPSPTPLPRGSEERVLLAGTPSETRLSIRHSGARGPATMVLGGVHGNEPGGWLAADEVASWEPTAGSLIVLPRANIQALNAFVRTFDEIADLNRMYPGDPDSVFLMERLAFEILQTCREFGVELLLDMHESWAFYAEHPPNSGTGALGQTITAGPGPQQDSFGQRIASIANPQVAQREQFIVREGTQFGRPTATAPSGQPQSLRGRSSLSAGGHVPGLTPILVEMGQTDQPLDRRVELHLITARAVLQLQGQI
ncbi:MAG: succinylglutamate desuccinylase/aspartoacylase family protein [Dehalococcoidia bacterium]|uniref:succinylglutamate desuccinylase/aspartoacylase domain-containing protein n=1 Tax=Candidatus Amarobacter glycogenicus TaxID=3140699 RepID=UPI003135F2B6|nr:succinylglutamate desuccinylase/aspartoacylase family protein [Dehalococcoidia bacterium]